MSERDEERWRDRPIPDGEESAEDRAAALLRNVEEPVRLSAGALARIRQRAIRGRDSAWSPSMRAALGLASLVAVAGIAAVIARLAGDRGVMTRIDAGTCEVTRLTGMGSLRLALIGPASMQMAATGKAPIVLDRGRLAIDSGDGEVTVDAGKARVIAGERARIEIEVIDGKVRIGAYEGTSRVVWREQTVDLAVGTVWTPDGVRPRNPARELSAEEALDGEVVSCEGDGVASVRNQTLPVKPPKLDEPAQPLAAPAIKPRKIAAVQQSDRPTVTPPVAPEKPVAPAASDHPAPPVDDPSDDRPAASESALAEESKLIADATQKLNHGGDAAGALAVLDRYRSRFPDGKLAGAALSQRVKALRALARGAEALALLDRTPELDEQLRLLRGELRAENGRCDDALSDFDATLDSAKSGSLEERALYGRASCRSRTGHPDDARRDLERLIQRFPSGKLAAEARRALAE